MPGWSGGGGGGGVLPLPQEALLPLQTASLELKPGQAKEVLEA